MPNDTKRELERLMREFDEQNSVLEALASECESMTGELPVRKADLDALDEACAVKTVFKPQRVQIGTRC